MVETGPQDPQALRHAAGQTGQGHGPGLLGDTRSDGQSRSSIPGRTRTVKDLRTWPCANLSLLSKDNLPYKAVWLVMKRTIGEKPTYYYYISNAPVSTRLR